MDDPGRIWVMNADGSAKRRVPLRGISPVPGPEDDPNGPFVAADAPSFAPSGERFAYLRTANSEGRWRAEIRSASLDGRRERRLAIDGRRVRGLPRWSPDGRRMAYWQSATPGRSAQIRVVNIRAGREEATITAVAGGLAGTQVDILDWSPTGRELLYPGPSGDGGLWRVGADGSKPRKLLDVPNAYMRDAVWSPDGRRIAFIASETVGENEYGEALVRHSLWTVAADGTGATKTWEGPSEEYSRTYPQLAWQPLVGG